MSLNAAAGLQGMLKSGHKHFDGVDDATAKNLEAGKQLADISRTSLGPNGMNKLVINHLERVFVTSDTATIVEELEVVHPAAKMLVMAAKMQEQELGDGTNLVVSIAGELLLKSASLFRMGLHSAEIVTGYKKAYDKCIELLEDMSMFQVTDPRDRDQLEYAIKTTLAAKQYGYEDVLSSLVAEACEIVMPTSKSASINVDNIRVSKIMGGNIHQSEVVKGMVVQRNAEGSVKRAEKAKVVVFATGIEVEGTEAKSTVLMKNADDLLNYSKGEEEKLEEEIRSIAESGAKVVIAGGSVSEMALHFLNKYKLMVIKIQSKWELRRLTRAVGATALVRLGAPTPDEMGFCDNVSVKEIGGRKVTIFRQDEEDSRLATILLRASTDNVLNDLERAVDSGVNCAKAVLRDPRFVAGAGATELELARQIQKFAEKTPGLDQYAIRKFGEALEVVPRTLAENAGMNATDVVSNLYSAHAKGSEHAGVDIEANKLISPEAGDSFGAKDVASEKGVVDHLVTKKSALRLGVDAAITVLRVDQIIMSKAAGGPKPPGM